MTIKIEFPASASVQEMARFCVKHQLTIVEVLMFDDGRVVLTVRVDLPT